MSYKKKFVKTLYDKNWLIEQYVTMEKSAHQIAIDLGTSSGVVTRNLKNFGVKTRTPSERQKSSKVLRGNHLDTLNDKDWLTEHYVDKSLNASEIARRVKVSVPTVFHYIRKWGLKAKTMSEAKEGRTLAKSTLHKYANEIAPPGFCVVCQEKEGQVHHIDGDRRNNAPENLERLCQQCHIRYHRLEEMAAKWLLKKRGSKLPCRGPEALREVLARGIPRKRIRRLARRRQIKRQMAILEKRLTRLENML